MIHSLWIAGEDGDTQLKELGNVRSDHGGESSFVRNLIFMEARRVTGSDERISFEDAGFAPDLDQRFALPREAGLRPDLHGVIALRTG